MSFKSLLEGARLGELFEGGPKELLAADHDLPIAAALAAMAQRRVLSLPVVVRSGRTEPRATRALVSTGGLTVTSLMGFVGVADVLAALISGARLGSAPPSSGLAAAAAHASPPTPPPPPLRAAALPPTASPPLRAAAPTAELRVRLHAHACECRDMYEGSPGELDALADAIVARPVSWVFGEHLHGAAGVAGSLGAGAAGRDWGVRGWLDAPLVDIIRANFLHASPAGSRKPANAVCHRLAVFDALSGPEDGAPTLLGVLSASDLVRWLAAHEGPLGSVARTPASEILRLSASMLAPASGGGASGAAGGASGAAGGPRRPPLVTVAEDDTTLSAFEKMLAAGVSGLAVVDARGRLAGNLSASDLRALCPGTFGALCLTVKAFLERRPLLARIVTDVSEPPAGAAAAPAGGEGEPTLAEVEALRARIDRAGTALRAATAAEGGGQRRRVVVEEPAPPAPPVTCAPDTPLIELCRQMAGRRVHRAYLVDAATGAPTDVVTATDVLAAVVALYDAPGDEARAMYTA